MAVYTLASGGDLQAALDILVPGDVLELEAGARWVGEYELPLTTASATEYITVTTTADPINFPGPNQRITPAHESLMPKLRAPINQPTLYAPPSTHHWKFLFVEFEANDNRIHGDIVRIGSSSSPQTSLAVEPHHFIFDRCYFHRSSTFSVIRALALHCRDAEVRNCHIADIFHSGSDAQAILCINGSGNHLIDNNFLEATGENIMYGGGDPAIPDLVPANITISRNHIYKPQAWRLAGKIGSVKNSFELKCAQDVVFEKNVVDGNWHDSQTGYTLLFKSVNQDGGHPNAVVQNVTIRNNIVRNVASVFNLNRKDPNPALDCNTITIENNLCYNVSGSIYGGSGRFMQCIGVSDVTVTHNTCISDGGINLYGETTNSPNFILNDNIIYDNGLGIKGAGSSEGTDTLNDWFNPYTAERNLIVSYDGGIYPATTLTEATSDPGFEDAASQDYRLAATSPFKGLGDGGSDPGVDFSLLTDTWKAVDGDYSSGVPSPPQFNRVGYFDSPTSTGQQVVTGVGITPKLVIFFGANHGVSGADQDDHHKFFGAMTASAQHAWGIEPLHNLAAGTTVTAHSDAHCLYVPDAGGTRILDAQRVSLDEDGFTIQWTDVWTTPIRVYYMAFGGADLEVAIGSNTAALANGTQEVTGLGFQPTTLITHAGNSQTLMPHTSGNHHITGCIGFANATDQALSGWRINTNDTSQNATTYQVTGKCFSHPDHASVIREAELDAFLPDGFRLNWTTTNGVGSYYFWIAIKGLPSAIGTFTTTPTAAHTQTVTGLGITPTTLFLQSANKAPTASPAAHARISWGFTDGNRRWSIWGATRDQGTTAANSFCVTRADTDRVLRIAEESGTLAAPTQTTQCAIDTVALQEGGFTVHYDVTDTTGQEVQYLAFGNLVQDEESPGTPSKHTVLLLGV